MAFVAAVGYDTVQTLQVLGILKAPWDDILIYGFSLLIATPFLLAMLALHYLTAAERRFWTHAAVLFGVIYTVYVTLNYVVQLATVIPASLKGALEPIRVLDQTPHSLFWDVDALGYIFMGLSTLLGAGAFSANGTGKWARRFFLANALVTPAIACVYFYPAFSYSLLLLGFPWGITAPGSILMLALFFRARAVKLEKNQVR